MSELNIPESWAEVRFEEAIEIQGGSQPPKSEFIHEPRKGYVRLIQIRDFRTDDHPAYIPISKSKRSFTKDDIMIGRYGPPVFQILRGKEGSYNVALMKASPTALLNKEFMYWFLSNPKIYADVNAVAQRSAGQTGVNLAFLNEYPVPIPPIKEQIRIFHKIESCFSKIEDTEKNLNKIEILLEKYRESLLAKAFRGELIPQNADDEPASVLLAKIREERAQNQKGKKKEQEFAPISDDEKPFEIPQSWEWVRLGEVINLKHGYAFKSQYFLKDEREYILTTPGNFFEKGGFRDLVEKRKYYEGPIDDEFILNPGDLIIPMTEQAPGLLGSGAYVPDNGKIYLHNQRLGKITTINSNLILKEYLFWYFNETYFRQCLASTCSGSTVRHTSPPKILSVEIPVPPFKEQMRIVEKMESNLRIITSLINPLRKKSSLMIQAKEAILLKAFEGRLVEQIESEGTGHELLQKILGQKNKEISLKESTKKKVIKKVSKKKATKK